MVHRGVTAAAKARRPARLRLSAASLPKVPWDTGVVPEETYLIQIVGRRPSSRAFCLWWSVPHIAKLRSALHSSMWRDPSPLPAGRGLGLAFRISTGRTKVRLPEKSLAQRSRRPAVRRNRNWLASQSGRSAASLDPLSFAALVNLCNRNETHPSPQGFPVA